MKVNSNGEIVIPREACEKAGLRPGMELEVYGYGCRIVIHKSFAGLSRGERLVEFLRGSGTGTMTTDEIMRLTRGEEWGKE